MVADPQRALDINVNASLEFLKLVLPPELAQVNRAFDSENFLEADVSPLSRIPTSDKHKPNEEWIAMRLKIEHEWLYRINPKWARKIYRKHIERKQDKDPDLGSEIWLHVKPPEELLERHRCEVEGRPMPELLTPGDEYPEDGNMRFEDIHTPRKEEVEYSGEEETE
jgi:platelet-activating factor acetylhydrolase